MKINLLLFNSLPKTSFSRKLYPKLVQLHIWAQNEFTTFLQSPQNSIFSKTYKSQIKSNYIFRHGINVATILHRHFLKSVMKKIYYFFTVSPKLHFLENYKSQIKSNYYIWTRNKCSYNSASTFFKSVMKKIYYFFTVSPKLNSLENYKSQIQVQL